MMPSDRDLLEQVCVQNAEAFDCLSARYREAVYRHVFSILHENDATEDIVQETFLRLWTRAEQWNGHGAFRSWLLRIATNQALNYLRSVQRRRQQPLEIAGTDEDEFTQAPPWMIDPTEIDPELQLERRERSDLLHRLIADLPAEKREVFALVHDHELEMRQIAERLGIPEGTVKSRLHYANKRLAHEWSVQSREWEDFS